MNALGPYSKAFWSHLGYLWVILIHFRFVSTWISAFETYSSAIEEKKTLFPLLTIFQAGIFVGIALVFLFFFCYRVFLQPGFMAALVSRRIRADRRLRNRRKAGCGRPLVTGNWSSIGPWLLLFFVDFYSNTRTETAPARFFFHVRNWILCRHHQLQVCVASFPNFIEKPTHFSFGWQYLPRISLMLRSTRGSLFEIWQRGNGEHGRVHFVFDFLPPSNDESILEMMTRRWCCFRCCSSCCWLVPRCRVRMCADWTPAAPTSLMMDGPIPSVPIGCRGPGRDFCERLPFGAHRMARFLHHRFSELYRFPLIWLCFFLKKTNSRYRVLLDFSLRLAPDCSRPAIARQINSSHVVPVIDYRSNRSRCWHFDCYTNASSPL